MKYKKLMQIFLHPQALCLTAIVCLTWSLFQTPQLSGIQSPNPAEAQVETIEKSPRLISEKLVAFIQSKYRVPEKTLARIVAAVESNAKDKGLDPVLVLAVIAQESSFRPKVVSHKDHGLMQVNTKWQRHRIEKKKAHDKLTHIETNIDLGTDILAEHCQRIKGCAPKKVLRRYNGIKDNPYPEMVMARYDRFKELNG